ncbi:hypothetical protein CK203_002376 [Vitis vinifera]|uniref:Reverse transcriptase/retrotransposon-derived protein RNase H-like domain-containing protein n=1 Tax=Vitis vinifera TaxID=29760 RepID=A0A438KI12_VITVI|nr:hypothetical protein CK203_002376 [Vitis vinifera]
MLTADRATCIVFSDDDLPPEGSNHVRPLFIDVALFRPSGAIFGPSTQTVRAYDGTQRTVMGTLSTHVMIGPAGAIPSSLHQKVKFIHEGRIITIQSDRDIITSSEPVLHISHSEDDLHLTGFTFDEVQVVSLEDGSRDMVPMSFDQHSSTLVLSMMRGMSYLPEADARYMSQLRRDRVRARMSGIPFDYPLRPYTFQLADYFIRGSEHTPAQRGLFTFQRHCTPITDRASVFSMCFPEEVPDYDLPMDLGYGTDEMDMIGIGIFDAAPRAPYCFRHVRSFVLETDEDDSIPDAYTDDMDFIGIGLLDVVTSDFTSVEGASDSVDPPLSLTLCPAPTTHIYDVDDVGDTDDPLGDQPREIRIGSSLSPDERSRLIDLLRPVKQKLRRLHPRWSLQVKEEIQKQLSVGFLSVVEYPEWLANVVPVPKKDGKGIRCYPSWMVFLGATYQRAATTLFHDMMHRDVEVYVDDMIFRLRLNPKKCTFGVTSGKLLGHIVSERGRLQYISRFIARLTDICEPIFLLRKNQPTVWNDDCQRAFERIKECLLSPPVLVPPTPGRPLLLYLSVSDMALGCMLAQLDDLGKERAIYYLSKGCLIFVLLVSRLDPLRYLFDRPVLTGRLMRWLIVDDDFPDEQIVSMTSITGWRLYFDGAANQSGFGIGILLYHHRVWRLHLILALDSWRSTGIPIGYSNSGSAPAYYCLIGEIEDQIELPWYHDIYQFLSCGTYPESASAKDRRALRQLATRFVICGDALYRRSPDGLLLLLAIDYFTKWVEALPMLIDSGQGGQIHQIAHYLPIRVPHELIFDRGVHFRGRWTLDSGVWHSASRLKAPFALWAYRTSFRTSTGATPYSLVYGMEVVLPVEIEMRSLRVALEEHVSEAEWAQSRYDQLSLLDEKRLRAADHAQAIRRR